MSEKKDDFCNQNLSFKLLFSSCLAASGEKYQEDSYRLNTFKKNPTIFINQEQYCPETGGSNSVFSEKYFNNDNNAVNSLMDKFYLAIPKDIRPLIESLEATNGVAAAYKWLPDDNVVTFQENAVQIEIVNQTGWEKYNKSKLDAKSSLCTIT